MKPIRIILTVAALTASSTAQAPLTALWALDSASGTIAADGSVNGNHGTLVNFGASPWVPAVFGNGLAFDGVDDHVNCMTNNGIPVHGTGAAYSITGWVNAPAQSDKRIYSEASAFSNTPLVTIGSGNSLPGNMRIYIRNDTNAQWGRQSTSTVFDSTWHHFAWVTNGNGGARLYVDGILDATDFNGTLGGTFTTDLSSLGAVLRVTPCCFLTGTLDDIRIYPFELTSTDVTLIMGNATLGTGFQINQPAARLDIDGFSSSVSGAGRANVAQGATFNLNLGTNLGGFPWELATTTSAAIPNAFIVDPSNTLNMLIGQATLSNAFFSTPWGTPLSLPGFPPTGYSLSTSISFTAPNASMFLTAQFAMADPASAAGFSLSGVTEIDVP